MLARGRVSGNGTAKSRHGAGVLGYSVDADGVGLGDADDWQDPLTSDPLHSAIRYMGDSDIDTSPH